MTEFLFQMTMVKFLNTPYVWGGDDPIKGIDCSGLVQELLSIIDLDPPGDQTAQGLYEYFKDKSTTTTHPHVAGTLVFYGQPGKITHVAMVFDGHTVIEAGGGGSRTNTLQNAIDQNAFVRLRSINRRKDIVAVLTPKAIPWNIYL